MFFYPSDLATSAELTLPFAVNACAGSHVLPLSILALSLLCRLSLTFCASHRFLRFDISPVASPATQLCAHVLVSPRGEGSTFTIDAEADEREAWASSGNSSRRSSSRSCSSSKTSSHTRRCTQTE